QNGITMPERTEYADLYDTNDVRVLSHRTVDRYTEHGQNDQAAWDDFVSAVPALTSGQTVQLIVDDLIADRDGAVAHDLAYYAYPPEEHMTLTTSLTKQARAVRAADQRLQDRRSDLDALILQGMDEGMTWTTLQQLTGLTPATLNASRRRAMRRREDRPESVAPAPRS